MTADNPNPFALEVPEPLWRFEGEFREHTSNIEALQLHNRYGVLRKALDKGTVKRYRKMLDKLTAKLEEYGVFELESIRDSIRSEFQELRSRNYELLKVIEQTDDPQELREARSEVAIIRENAKSIKDDLRAANERLVPYRKYLYMYHQLTSRLEEHEIAVEQQALLDKTDNDLARENHMIEAIIIKEFNGFDMNHITSDGKRKRTDTIKFDVRIATPDTHQFRVAQYRAGLFGGYLRLLPHGVDVIKKLQTTSVLQQISSALGMVVTCPQVESNKWKQGIWLFVQRNGMAGGLPENVSYTEFMSMYPSDKSHLLPVPGGVREQLWANWIELAKQPHMLITGSTGSGKSNTINAIISTLISMNSPAEVQLMLCDLKEGIEFSGYKGIPHLVGDVITTPEQCAHVMVALENERARRMHELRLAGARDINAYNARHPTMRMPHLVIVFDEFGALAANQYKSHSRTIYDVAAQLAMKSRAAGIHMVIGVQTPSKEHIPRDVRDNITTRFSGRQQNMYASIGATGSKAAADLPDVKGRFLCDYMSTYYQVQMPRIEDDQIEEAIATAKRYEPVEIDSSRFGFGEVEDDLALPATLVKREFSYMEFISLCIEHLDGILNYTKVYKMIKDDPDYDISWSKIIKMADEIKESFVDGVEYNGKCYQLVTHGRGKRFEEVIDLSRDGIMSLSVDQTLDKALD